MRYLRTWLAVNLARVLCGLFLFSLLQACVTVEVGKDACDKSKGGGGQDPGACTVAIAWAGGSAAGFKDTVTNLIYPSDTTVKCLAATSKKCSDPSGTCGFGGSGGPCISWYRARDSYCYCGCTALP